MTDITMPILAEGMQEGTIIAWLVADGQPVAIGDELMDVETDKATVTCTSDVDGILNILVAEGRTVPVGEIIARAMPAGEVPRAVVETPDGPPRHDPVLAPSNGDARSVGTVTATPVARRIAAAHNVVLDRLTGTGPAGRVVKADVLRAVGIAAPRQDALNPEPGAASLARSRSAKGDTQRVEPTRLQQIVASRMAEAKATIPHFQVQTDVVMNDALTLRAQLKAAAAGDVLPSINDIVVRACARALRDHPLVNGSYRDGAYELHSRINVGIAVASADGLVVVSIKDADIKSLGQIAREAQALAERARAGTISPPDVAGATFTVSNLGMFGMTAITPVINPPQAAILGVGATRSVLARAKDGEIVDQQVLTLTLSCDHRILNGADGSCYLADVKARLEAPLGLLL